MRQTLGAAVLLTVGLLLASSSLGRAQAADVPPPPLPAAPPERPAASPQPAPSAQPARPAEPPPPEERPGRHEAVRKKVEEVKKEVGERVKDFATYADGYLGKASERPLYGWCALAGTALIGTLALFFGWTFLQWLLVPSAPLLGLATGGFTAFCIVQSLYTSRPAWFRLTLVGLGVALGVSLYLFSALKAKPVAVFLVILSPFLMFAAFLFSYSTTIGHSAAVALIIFCMGFAAGFAAMIEVRPLSIVATSMLGAAGLVATWGLLSHLLQGNPAFVSDVFKWLIENPLMLGLAWVALVFVGVSFQFATGPRGGLEG